MTTAFIQIPIIFNIDHSCNCFWHPTFAVSCFYLSQSSFHIQVGVSKLKICLWSCSVQYLSVVPIMIYLTLYSAAFSFFTGAFGVLIPTLRYFTLSSSTTCTFQILAFFVYTFSLCTFYCHNFKKFFFFFLTSFKCDYHLLWNHSSGASHMDWLMIMCALLVPCAFYLSSNPYHS